MAGGDALDVTRVRRLLEAQFPHLGAASVHPLGEGCDSKTCLVDNAWVFRFPKRAEVELQLFLEARVLPVLAATSPVPLPVICFHGHPSAWFPRHFGGYARLPGVPGIELEATPVLFQRVAPPLAHFLSWLHSFPPREAARLGVPRQPITPRLEEIRAEALADFDAVVKAAPDAPLEAWRRTLEAGIELSPACREAATLVHNDLAAEHILLDPSTHAVTGIFDWSDIALGDPAIDFAGLLHWGGEAFVQAVLSAYAAPCDAGLVSRARFFAACRGVGDVNFGLETGRQEYVQSGIRGLAHSAGQSAGTNPTG